MKDIQMRHGRWIIFVLMMICSLLWLAPGYVSKAEETHSEYDPGNQVTEHIRLQIQNANHNFQKMMEGIDQYSEVQLFSPDHDYQPAISMIYDMTEALFGSEHTCTETDVDEAIDLYVYMFVAKIGSLGGPNQTETWTVKHRAFIRSSQKISSGRYSPDGVRLAADIGMNYMYDHIPFIRQKDEAYIGKSEIMNDRLYTIEELLMQSSESDNLIVQCKSYADMAEQMYLDGHPAWCAEWTEKLLKLLKPDKRQREAEINAICINAEMVEYLIAVSEHQPDRDLVWIKMPYNRLYYLYGMALSEMQLYDEAVNALRQAEEWAPYSFNAFAEECFVLENLNRLDELETVINMEFRCAYRKEHFAHAYRHLGWLYIERGEWEIGMACEQCSLWFDPDSSLAKNEIQYIMNASDIRELNDKQIFKLLSSNSLLKTVKHDFITLCRDSAGQNNSVSSYLETIADEMEEINKIIAEKSGVI